MTLPHRLNVIELATDSTPGLASFVSQPVPISSSHSSPSPFGWPAALRGAPSPASCAPDRHVSSPQRPPPRARPQQDAADRVQSSQGNQPQLKRSISCFHFSVVYGLLPSFLVSRWSPHCRSRRRPHGIRSSKSRDAPAEISRKVCFVARGLASNRFVNWPQKIDKNQSCWPAAGARLMAFSAAR